MTTQKPISGKTQLGYESWKNNKYIIFQSYESWGKTYLIFPLKMSGKHELAEDRAPGLSGRATCVDRHDREERETAILGTVLEFSEEKGPHF